MQTDGALAIAEHVALLSFCLFLFPTHPVSFPRSIRNYRPARVTFPSLRFAAPHHTTHRQATYASRFIRVDFTRGMTQLPRGKKNLFAFSLLRFRLWATSVTFNLKILSSPDYRRYAPPSRVPSRISRPVSLSSSCRCYYARSTWRRRGFVVSPSRSPS